MNLMFKFYSVSIVFMHQIFSGNERQRAQRSHFEAPSLPKPRQKINLSN